MLKGNLISASAVLYFLWLWGMGIANAIPFGVDVTIWDQMGLRAGRCGGTHEDQEVEPGNKKWNNWQRRDLEGFLLNGSNLSIVAGFDFKNAHRRLRAGDIFIDVTGDARYGSDIQRSGWGRISRNSFGYDYVLDMNYAKMTYTVYELNRRSYTSLVSTPRNAVSNAWRFKKTPGDTAIAHGTIYYWEGLSDLEAGGFKGGKHYAATVDLSFLPMGSSFTSHFTTRLGIDNLMGKSSMPIPEPGTLMLVGTGLLVLAGVSRKKKLSRQ
ncbi:PEP-CTERM sorting domain-containing protein [Desulforhabdus amnigena]|jgi:hypothetical protein|uniref:Ice-binding protein C-terminal domain-containing protein n=1 Tax=Desulforhabdus amnigena TaxID=40218 RepID=A0A9W6FTM6_9BACT|nr:PEP-CTERM sorting domain-containing protein [Desulforhabdus amnigena]NLJ29009.1 PEP-CTERM sorting domain-containing protein [Deltaproteobacteria bacterium]GLI33666.1 hypothetical protein DAMNIGENAA_10990 [Desulforhabdus amnigena]